MTWPETPEERERREARQERHEQREERESERVEEAAIRAAFNEERERDGGGGNGGRNISWQVLGGILLAILVAAGGAYQTYVLRRIDDLANIIRDHLANPTFHSPLVARVTAVGERIDAMQQDQHEVNMGIQSDLEDLQNRVFFSSVSQDEMRTIVRAELASALAARHLNAIVNPNH